MNPVKRLFLTCSGADVAILARPECRIEHNQYIGIGAAILSTSVFAAVSGGYALYTSFHSTTLSVTLGLFWGLTIFNLDRYLVSSMRKKPLPPVLTFRESIRLKTQELAMVMPRLILAVFISVLISKPLELRVFEKEIDAQLAKNFSRQIVDMQNRIKQEFTETEQLSSRIESLKEEIASKEREKSSRYDLAMEEAIGKSNGKASGRPGKGSLYRERMQAFNQAESEYLQTRSSNERQIDSINERLSLLRKQEDDRINEAVATIRQATGLIPRLNAFDELSSTSRAVAWANIFIVLLFLLLEISPILVKLLSARGPYDDIYEILRTRFHTTAGVVVTASNDAEIGASASTDSAGAIHNAATTPQNESINNPDPQETVLRRKDPYRLVGGTFAGKYRLQTYAGGGGMGAVYQALDLDDKRPVAVKILKPDILERNASYADLFDREVRAVRQLEHPHIVKIIDSGVSHDDEISFMVMEWLHGETLEEVLSHGPLLSLERIQDMMFQICDAIAYAHKNNTIHLDIKPANIFLIEKLGSADYIKVIDFGMARILSSETGTTVTRFLGTYQYCSPEHFGGKVSQRSDIYSLGATLYHMLAGVIPFGASYINAKAHPHLELPPVPLLRNMRPDLPHGIDAVVQKALSKNPGDRQESAIQLLEEFRAATQTSEVMTNSTQAVVL
jgi:hypothetical protein